jgi:hypothetical protein
MNWLIGVLIVAGMVYAAMEMQDRGERTERRRKQQEVYAAIGKAEAEMMAQIRSDDDPTSVSIPRQEAVDKFRQQLAKGAEIGGAEGRMLKIIADYTGEIQAATKPYQALMEKMRTLGQVGSVDSPEDIEQIRELAREFLRINANLRKLQDGFEPRVRSEMQNSGLPKADVEAELTRTLSYFSSRAPLQRRIRASEEELGKTMLELCDFLEAEWGKWKLVDGVPTFETPGAETKFRGFFERMRLAENDEVEAKRELLDLAD